MDCSGSCLNAGKFEAAVSQSLYSLDAPGSSVAWDKLAATAATSEVSSSRGDAHKFCVGFDFFFTNRRPFSVK